MRWLRWMRSKNNSLHFTAFLTTIHRISYKNSPHQLLLRIYIKNAVIAVIFCKKCGDCGEWGKKKIHRISPNFVQQFTAKFTAFKKKCTSTFVANLYKKCGECGEWGKKYNSPHFTEILTTIYREIHRISYENYPHQLLMQINVELQWMRWKKTRCTSHKFTAKFTAFLTKITLINFWCKLM